MAAVQTPGTPTPEAAPPAAAPATGGADADFAAAVALLEGGEAAAPATETAPPEPKPPELEKPKEPQPELTDSDISARFAKLTAHERRHKERVAARSNELNEKEAKLTAREQAIKEFESTREQAKQNPLSALKALGWSIEDLTRYVSENGVVPREKILQDLKVQQDEELKKRDERLKELNDKIEAREKAEQAAATERAAQAYEQKTFEDMKSVLTSAEAAKFPMLARVNGVKAHRAVLRYITTHYDKNEEAIEAGEEKPLALTDAMIYAERELAELFPGGVPQAPGQAGTIQLEKPGAAKPEVPPITQRDLSARTVTPPSEDEDDKLTPEERWEKAKKVLEGE